MCVIYLQDHEEEGQGKKGGRVRSLSTGSITKPMSPEHAHHEVELETNALLLSDQSKPKSRKVCSYLFIAFLGRN